MVNPRASFTVDGYPAPKGSRAFLGKGRSKESSERCKPWVEQVAWVARAHRPASRTLEPPYTLGLKFRMPLGRDKPKWGWPTKDGDLDKLARAVLDGLTQGLLILDDRHVIGFSELSKEFSQPSAVGVDVMVL